MLGKILQGKYQLKTPRYFSGWIHRTDFMTPTYIYLISIFLETGLYALQLRGDPSQ